MGEVNLMIIFDEKKYAINLLNKTIQRDYIKWEDLLILAKYFRSLDKSEKQIRIELINFCINSNPNFNEVIFDKSISSAISKSEKQHLKLAHPVTVNKIEIETIRSLQNYNYEKILFVMLVISRHNKTSYNSNYYINYNLATILPYAKVYVSKSERDYIKHYLYEQKMIEAIPPNTRYFVNGRDNFKLLYSDDTSGSYVSVPDPIESVFFYPVFCEICGKEIGKKYHQRHEMCEDCYREKRLGDKRLWIQNTRNYTNVDS